MVIETNKLRDDLTDKRVAQLVHYCAVEGIEWAALAHGRELQFFNTFLKRDLAAKRVMHLDILAFNSDEEFDGIFVQLWQLSRPQMTVPSGVRTWMYQRRMDGMLRQVLMNLGSAVMGHLQSLLTEADIPVTPKTSWDGSARILRPGRESDRWTAPCSKNCRTSLRRRLRPEGGESTRRPTFETRADRGRLSPPVEAGVLPPST